MLPYGRQTIDADDVVAVMNALGADFLTTGPRVEEFEAAFAEAVGAPYAVAVSSGTAALHLMMLDLEPRRVAVPAITFLATANAVRHVSGEVAFCDVDPDSGLMTPDALMKALEGDPVDGVIPVHLRGDLVDPGVFKVARALGLWVVEDACHALGSRWTLPGGPTSDATIYSFHPVKTITTGEGGMVTTADRDLADRLRLLRNHGARNGEMTRLGYNYRLPDLNCALGISQLRKLDAFAERRRALVARYNARLAPLAPRVRVAVSPEWSNPAPHLMTVLVERRDRVKKRLAEKGVGTQIHYKPVHRQPYYVHRYGHLHLPGADAYAARCLSLPLFPSMADEDVDRVVEALACSL